MRHYLKVVLVGIAMAIALVLTVSKRGPGMLVGIGRSTVYAAIKAGHLKLSKYGKRSFIKREEALRFVGKM